MTERWEVLRQAEWPRLDAAGLVNHGAMGGSAVAALGAARLLAIWVGRKLPPRVELPEGGMEKTTG